MKVWGLGLSSSRVWSWGIMGSRPTVSRRGLVGALKKLHVAGVAAGARKAALDLEVSKFRVEEGLQGLGFRGLRGLGV